MTARCGMRRQCPESLTMLISVACLLLLTAVQVSGLASGTSSGDDRFHESLGLKPLADGRLYASFSFDLTSPDRMPQPGREQATEIFGIVPRSLVHLARASDAQQMHLSINAGRWDYSKWGQPDGDDMVGTGAELWAKVRRRNGESNLRNDTIPASSLAKWRRLTADLAGLFCASLDALDGKLTVEPFGQNPVGEPEADTTTLRASLASETICTENLSTLLKLLPCKTLTGLASLLEPHHFFRSDFHGMAIHLENQGGLWKSRINVHAVFSPVMQVGVRKNRNWSLLDIFGKRLVQSCPLADRSSITVYAPPGGPSSRQVTEENVDFGLWPLVMSPEQSRDIDEDEDLSYEDKLRAKGRRFSANVRRKGSYTYDTSRSTDLDIQMVWPGEASFTFPHYYDEPKLTASRIFSGYGQERGTIEVTVRNAEKTREKYIFYEEVLPWFVKPYLHTLRATTMADDFDEDSDDVVRFADDLSFPPLVSLNYTPSIPRRRPFHLLARLRVPPQSTVRLVYEYDKAFLRYAEHPPDAHRGFDIAPAVITVQGDMESAVGRLYTESALVEVAVPDFSMPYNVIIFTSTLIALCAGSTLNNLVRKYTDVLQVERGDRGK